MTVQKTYGAEFKAVGDESSGKVEALVSIFNNVDLVGDRVLPGAFEKSITRWKDAGDPIPVVFSHQWDNVMSHIGVVDGIEETERGLKATYTLDVADNPVAAQVYRLMKRRTLKEHSFAYEIKKERRAKDGANELVELDIIEIGPTLRGANPETELLAVKAAVEEMKSGRAISSKTEGVIRGAIDGLRTQVDALEELLTSREDPGTATEEKSDAPDAKAEEPETANAEEQKDATTLGVLAAIAAAEAAMEGTQR